MPVSTMLRCSQLADLLAALRQETNLSVTANSHMHTPWPALQEVPQFVQRTVVTVKTQCTASDITSGN